MTNVGCPNRRVTNHKTFVAVERCLRTTNSFAPPMVDCGRNRTSRTPVIEEEMLK